ncbi:MAG: GNAT family N-acetyltransferase [Rhodothermia bacterium]|nr:GNAT family N-acetyltransferase [Rhodothermia bacterium]
MSSFRVHVASWEDAEAIVAFNLALAWESEGLTLDPERVRAGVEAVLRDSQKGRYWIAKNESTPVGQLLITREWSDWRARYFWWVQSVYVAPSWRGRGVFRALLREVQAAARASSDVCGLRLYVHQENRMAMAVYERTGFRRAAYAIYERDCA